MNPVSRISQTDAAVEQIKTFLLSDNIQVGEKLPTEKKLCETLRVGRSTIREAIRVLQVMGYVKIYPGRGAFLAAKELNNASPGIVSWFESHEVEIQHVVEVRMALEVLAVKLAVERASQAELEIIDDRRRDFEDTLAREEYAELTQKDVAFHMSIFGAAKNELLMEMIRGVNDAFQEFRTNSFLIKEHAANAVIPHRDITRAMFLRESEFAQVLMRRHMEKILEDREAAVKSRELAAR